MEIIILDGIAYTGKDVTSIARYLDRSGIQLEGLEVEHYPNSNVAEVPNNSSFQTETYSVVTHARVLDGVLSVKVNDREVKRRKLLSAMSLEDKLILGLQ